MTKKITIKKCTDCPHFSHSGEFTPGGSKPCCDHPKTVETKGYHWKERVIPYKNITHPVLENKLARVPKRIPDWCPLED